MRVLTVSSQVYVPKLKKLEEDKQLWLRKQRAIHGLEMARAVIHQNKSWLDDFSDEQILAGYQKKKLAFSIYNMRESEIVSIPGLRGGDPKEISLKNLSKIIKARVEEIIDQVYRQITSYGFQEGKNKLIAGIVLTGGGAQLKHIKQLTEYITGMSTRIGFANEHLAKGTPEEISHPSYATSVGLVLRGLKVNNLEDIQEEDDFNSTKSKVSFFETWSKKFLNYLLNE